MSSLPLIALLESPPVNRLIESISRFGFYLRPDARIVFVCGAAPTKSNRETLLRYSTKHLEKFRFFRAEEVFKALGGNARQDLLTIEDDLARFSHCIIVICESSSAFAELGAFSLSNDLVKQLLIINDKEFKTSSSFINLGPIKKCDEQSAFRPTVYADFNSLLKSIPEIEERLLRIPHQRAKRIEIGESPFEGLAPIERLLMMADLINLIGPIQFSEIVALLKKIFNVEHLKIETELALGLSLELFAKLTTSDDKTYFFHSLKRKNQFINYRISSRTHLRSEIIRFYMQKDRCRMTALQKVILNDD